MNLVSGQPASTARIEGWRSACLKDGPAYFSTPRAHLGGVLGSHEIVLPQRPFDGQLMTRHVCGQGSVGKIDVGVRARVDYGREFNGRHNKRDDPAYRMYLGVAGDEHRRLAARLREDG